MKGKGSILVEISVLLVAIVAMILLLPSASAQHPVHVWSSPNIFGGYDYSSSDGRMGYSSPNIFGGYDYIGSPGLGGPIGKQRNYGYGPPHYGASSLQHQGHQMGKDILTIINAFRRNPAAPPKPKPVQRPKRKDWAFTDWDHKYW